VVREIKRVVKLITVYENIEKEFLKRWEKQQKRINWKTNGKSWGIKW
jgi:hypothetical protein